MKGRKPKLDNVLPLTGNPGAKNEQDLARRARERADQLRPRGLTAEERKEWDRIAPMLADPRIDRLKPHFVDAALELCRANIRLRKLRAFFVAVAKKEGDETTPLDAEIHKTYGRNGEQLKSHPHVAQINETWRQWRSLVAMFGLTPTDERNMAPGQGDLFGDPAEQYLGNG